MEEKNELGDIILNKGNKEGGSKKVILAAATLGIILIVVVLLMNTLSSESQNNLPQTALPPKPAQENAQANVQNEEPLFEDVEVIDEKGDSEDEKLEKIAKELKEQSVTEEPEVEEVASSKSQVQHPQPKPAAVKKTAPAKTAPKKSVAKGHYYVQVGSFSKYRPNKKFLSSIKREGYNYIFHKATVHGRSVTKVLVGPFRSEREARNALKKIRKRIEKGAFLTKI